MAKVKINQKYLKYNTSEVQSLLGDVEKLKENPGLFSETNTASGNNAVAIGDGCTASGNEAFALGDGCTASGNNAVAEGHGTVASGSSSHAEGKDTKAIGRYAHAEGEDTTAAGRNSHAGGSQSEAYADGSFAHGTGLQTSNDNEVAFGKLNKTKQGLAFSIGAGRNIDDFDDPDFPVKRVNIVEILEDGTMNIMFEGQMKSVQDILRSSLVSEENSDPMSLYVEDIPEQADDSSNSSSIQDSSDESDSSDF